MLHYWQYLAHKLIVLRSGPSFSLPDIWPVSSKPCPVVGEVRHHPDCYVHMQCVAGSTSGHFLHHCGEADADSRDAVAQQHSLQVGCEHQVDFAACADGCCPTVAWATCSGSLQAIRQDATALQHAHLAAAIEHQQAEARLLNLPKSGLKCLWLRSVGPGSSKQAGHGNATSKQNWP